MPIATRMTSEERRRAILDAAMKLFSERGYRGTTTRALAEAVGVSEPVLYEHFHSKRDLYAAIVDMKSRQAMERAATLLDPLVASKDDRALFVTLGKFILERFREDQAYSRLLISAPLEDPSLGAIFFERQRPGFEALSKYIGQRIRDGAFRPVNPALACRAFIGMVHYHGHMGMVYRDDFVRLEPCETVEQLVDLFLRGIRNTEGPSTTTSDPK